MIPTLIEFRNLIEKLPDLNEGEIHNPEGFLLAHKTYYDQEEIMNVVKYPGLYHNCHKAFNHLKQNIEHPFNLILIEIRHILPKESQLKGISFLSLYNHLQSDNNYVAKWHWNYRYENLSYLLRVMNNTFVNIERLIQIIRTYENQWKCHI